MDTSPYRRGKMGRHGNERVVVYQIGTFQLPKRMRQKWIKKKFHNYFQKDF